jgi:transcriptional regulator with XRE-family HTH domain
VGITMKSDYIEDVNNESLSFGSILKRERKKLGKSLKEIEKDLTVEVEELEDGVLVKKDKALVTASYMNRIENGNREGVSFSIACILIEKFNLDFNEVLKSFGHENILSSNSRQGSIEAMIRINDIEVPTKIDNGKPKQLLSSMGKEILIRVINDVFEFGTANEENTMYVLKKIIEELDDYRKSVRKLK